MYIKKLKRFLVGEPISNQFAHQELLPKWKALSVLSSDALSSVAYATQEILLALSAFAVSSVIWSIPVALGISALIVVVTASYWQTIKSYPNGGGAYIVAKENLGQTAGLVAGAALLIDYVLTVSVSVASGVENIVSAFPQLLHLKVYLGIFVVLIITLFNLRGVRESATVFALPTYFFILSVLLLLGMGAYRYIGGTLPNQAPIIHNTYAAIPLILFLRAFASGCSAMTGIEAISNGVPIFREPAQKNAQITLVWMSGILAVMFIGITVLAHSMQLVPTEDQTLISLMGLGVFGKTGPYYMIQASVALILFLAANTSYADFPRLSSLLAKDRFLPRQLANVGDRLVFSNGIIGLSISAMGLLYLFGGDTHKLIPLYAVGVFLSFTLSQSGMVVHHFKEKEPRWQLGAIINGTGALVTGIVLLDIGYTKFSHGAWLIIIAIPTYVWFFRNIYKHYIAVGKELSLADEKPCKLEKVKHTVIIPISGIHRGVLEAIRYAMTISDDVFACYVDIDPVATERVKAEWERWCPGIPFVVLKSPYRSITQPLLDYIDDVEKTCHDDMITVLIPEFVTTKWWQSLLHNQTALFLRATLAFKRGKVVTSVRYHLKNS